jgi:hypothetical protein
MKSCSSTAFEGIDGNEDAASRDLELVAAARASESGEPALTIDGRITTLNSEQVYDLRQRSHCALRAISKLNVRLRTPTATLIERECSMKEVACTLDLSLAAVKSRLYRAREQLPCSVAFKGRVPNVGSISGSKRQYVVPSLQNVSEPQRELNSFINSMASLIGPGASGTLTDLWLRELACMECIPGSETFNWRSVSVSASVKLASRVISSQLSSSCF